MHAIILAAEGSASTSVNWSQLGITSDVMMSVFNDIKGLIPIVAPAVIAFLGFRKAWAFLRSAIAGA